MQKPWASLHVVFCERNEKKTKWTIYVKATDKAQISLELLETILLTWIPRFQVKLNVSEVASLATQMAASLSPLCEVPGEIFNARKASSWGANGRKKQLAILRVLWDLTNQKSIELHFLQPVLTTLEVQGMVLVSGFERCKHQRDIIRPNRSEQNIITESWLISIKS